MADDALNDGLVIDEAFVGKVKREGGRGLRFDRLSREEQEKVRDKHVIDIIKNHVKADEITHIRLYDCVGITDATIKYVDRKSVV